jgi:hypothetical protein
MPRKCQPGQVCSIGLRGDSRRTEGLALAMTVDKFAIILRDASTRVVDDGFYQNRARGWVTNRSSPG